MNTYGRLEGHRCDSPHPSTAKVRDNPISVEILNASRKRPVTKSWSADSGTLPNARWSIKSSSWGSPEARASVRKSNACSSRGLLFSVRSGSHTSRSPALTRQYVWDASVIGPGTHPSSSLRAISVSEFLNDRSLTPPQIRFVETVIDQLTARGVMDASALYEAPFSNLHAGGPDELFADQAEVIELIFEKLKAMNAGLRVKAG